MLVNYEEHMADNVCDIYENHLSCVAGIDYMLRLRASLGDDYRHSVMYLRDDSSLFSCEGLVDTQSPHVQKSLANHEKADYI